MTDSIFALASGPMPCAVAIVRVSGPAVRDCALDFCGRLPPDRKAMYAEIRSPETGALIDHGLVIYFPGPKSFTGEDCLEFQVHGSRAVVALLLRSLGARPCMRLAEPGEFIRRAFEHGKMPLTSVEGLADLIDARTELQRQQALSQAGGHLARRADLWREKLLEARALLEAEIDFADEGDAPVNVLEQVRSICRELITEWEQALRDAQRGEQIRNGFRVVIAGPPNAGKSSLMNCLARRPVSIVTEHAGTTRDLIEIEMDLDGCPVVLCDTAGLRHTTDPVEEIGIGMARDALANASLVIMLTEATCSVPETSHSKGRVVHVASKIDLAPKPCWADVGISPLTGEGVEKLIEIVAQEAANMLDREPALVTHERQRRLIERGLDELNAGLNEVEAVELLAEHLRCSSDLLACMTGAIDSDAVLGEVFSRFCMGK